MKKKSSQPITRKEFIERCSNGKTKLSYNTLRSDIHRGHVLVLDDNKIDPDDPMNAAYIEKRLAEANDNTKMDRLEADLEKKRLEKEKAEEELIITRIKRQKLQGELIPTDVMKIMFSTHFKSMTQAFQNASEQMVTDLVKRLGGNAVDVADAKGRLLKSINAATKKGMDQTGVEMEKVVEEFSSLK